MRRIYLIIIYAFALLFGVGKNVCASGVTDGWQVYPSYWVATQNVVAGKSVYSLMNGNLLRYDTEDGSVKTYDCLHDLNDVHINHIAYSPEAKRLILVYDNENIDLLDLDDNVLNISSLKDKALTGKQINGICIQGTTAYLATGFGFLSVNVKDGVVLDTYNLGIDVQSVTISEGVLWVCGANGVYNSALTNSEMHNLASWKRRHTAANWYQLVDFDGDVYARHKSGIYCFTDKTSASFKAGSFSFLKKLTDGQMVFGSSSQLFIYSNKDNGKSFDLKSEWNDVTKGNSGLYWVSEGMSGLRAYKLKDNVFEPSSEVIQPNSPVRDLFYHMHYVTDGQGGYRLLVAGGINTFLAVHNPATAMMLDGDKWSYLDEQAPAQQYPGLFQWNTTDVVQDPSDPTHHYASPFRTGLYEYKDRKFVKLYNCDNSPLRSILPKDANFRNYVSATCLAFDDNNNLWMCNQETDTIIRVMTADKKWHALYYSEIAETPQCDGYLFSTSGINFLTCRRMDGRGFFAFTTNGTLNTVRDDKHVLLTTIVNQRGTSYSPNNFYCMTEDLDGRIWCGTDHGIFVIDNPEDVFDKNFRFTQVEIARNDGSGLVDYLLNGVEIKCIAVDGGNRKWVGTSNDGIYLISPDGTELIHHFLHDETPLLSNEIQSIAIHPLTGEVMIGTDKGLCSFRSDATEAEQELDEEKVVAYPNPVRPDYNGPIRIEGLTFNSEVKICSVTGQIVWAGRSNGGTCAWNGRDRQGRRVASGVYNVIANTEDGNKAVVTRIIVIK